MRGAQLREALRSGKRVYGIAMESYGQPRWPAYFARLNLDYVWLESEHAPHNRETIAWALQAYAAHGIAPLLRIPEISAARAAMAVDAGAHGVIVPYVETVAQVKDIVGAVKYRPLKGQALRRALDEGVFPDATTEAYLQSYNPDAVVIIMIESQTGIDNLPDLLAVPGVDAVLMGPHDLTVNLGIAEQYDHPRFLESCKTIARICRAHGVGSGIHYISGDLDRAQAWAEDWGCNLISHRGDTLFVARGVETELDELRRRLDGEPVESRPDEVGKSGHLK